jgi:hypothetical protein
MRIRTVAGAAALALLLHAPSVRAEKAVGEEAITFGSGGCLNTEPVEVGNLVGRVILLELFSTT